MQPHELSQTIILPQTKVAFFINLKVPEGQEQAAIDALTGLAGTVDGVSFRDPHSHLSAVVGIGSQLWDRLFDPSTAPKPEGLHDFVPLEGDKHSAPSTGGDLFFHIRSDEFDRAFELTRRIKGLLGDEVETLDEVHAFRYMDYRDPLGFVDGTESPQGRAGADAALIAEGQWAGGSYIVEQKYTHNLKDWEEIGVEEQQRVIGRTKAEDIEFDDAEKPHNSHVFLNSVEDADGNSLEIVRDNLAFGKGTGEQGTFFMSYANDVRVTELMLRRMFLGEPRGNYDRILDFSTPLTGANFFAPPQEFIDAADEYVRPGLLPDDDAPADPSQPATQLSAAKGLYPQD